ncbi:MAG: bifunctional diaminohydroxyphosphoribosylaminopyrimidine deaminase/5-amino-6-(5-phosphoribosylamino)uracil reductase RibD [Sulfuricurvum sp.]
MNPTLIDRAMNAALIEAWRYQLLTFPNPAVGASCMDANGAILSVGAHQRAGGPHAEVYALRDTYTLLSGDHAIAQCDDAHVIHEYLRLHHHNLFHEVSMAVTLEPCSHSGKTPSCAMLIRDLGLKELFIACKDPNPEAANGGKILEEAGVACTLGVMESEGEALLEPFVTWQNKPFVFFKWAQRLDGTIDGGTVSSYSSRAHVHALRDKCDLLVVGGNTVRTDRPTLDARMVGGKAPDILIYSHYDDFDRSIPLFTLPDRRVFVENTLEKIGSYRMVMIEGGSGMFEAAQSAVNWFVCYIAPNLGGGTAGIKGVTEEFEVLHATISDNILLWMKSKH